MTEEQFRPFNILFLSMLMGQVLMLGVIYFGLGVTHQGDIFAMIVPFVILGGIGAAYFIYQSRKAQGAELDDIDEKIVHYRSSFILRAALIEGPTLLGIVGYFLDGNPTYLMYIGAGLLAFIFFRPSIAEFERDYLSKI